MRSRAAMRLCIGSFVGFTAVVLTVAGCGPTEKPPLPSAASAAPDTTLNNARRMVEEGRRTFRFDTFGSEVFWGETLGLHQAIAGDKHGGVGGGVSPKSALDVGLKVDSEALPALLVDQIKKGAVDLDDPANTLVLLKVNAVVGVKGLFDGEGRCAPSASRAPCATRRWTIRSRQASGVAWTAGPTGISMLA